MISKVTYDWIITRKWTIYQSADVYNISCGVLCGSVLGRILYLLCTSPLGDILRAHNISLHFYADDNQLNTTFTYNIVVD